MQGLEVEIGGKSYPFRFTVNNLADMEEKAGKTVMDLLVGVDNVGFATLRLFFWAGFRNPPYRGLTIEAAGQMLADYLDEGRNMQDALKMVYDTLEACGFVKNQQAEVTEAAPTSAEPTQN